MRSRLDCLYRADGDCGGMAWMLDGEWYGAVAMLLVGRPTSLLVAYLINARPPIQQLQPKRNNSLAIDQYQNLIVVYCLL